MKEKDTDFEVEKSEEISDVEVTENESDDEMDEAAELKKKKGLFVGLSATILLVIIISVIVTTVLMRAGDKGGNPGGDSSAEVEEEEEEIVENTELTSGTVTATIGGQSVTYKAKYVVDGITATIKEGTYESAIDDEIVFLVINGGKLRLEDAKVNKAGSAGLDGRGDNYSFFGTNSAIVVVGEGSEAKITRTTVSTATNGANAIVATNAGSVKVNDITIATTNDGSRGLHATFGGKIEGKGGTITTSGGSSASLATDRGEGMVTVSDMTLKTEGPGSPLIYSTGDIKVSNSTGTSTGAQVAVIEGKNSVTLDSCDFSTNGIGNRNSVDNAIIMIYQSMSGDASVGKGSFSATKTKLKVLDTSAEYTMVPFFFVTNTEAEVTLSDVTAEFYDGGYFALVKGTEEWGRSGSNGGNVVFSVDDLTASSYNVGIDEISSVSGL